MSFRTWLYVFAIGITLGSLAQAQEQNGEPSQSAPNQEDETETLPFTLPVIVVESDESAIASQREEAERTQREKDDLIAQQGMNAATQAMNDATQSMKWASWVSAGLVGLGTILLVWTLKITRDANTAANRGASAAERVLTEIERPWVLVEGLGARYGMMRDESGTLSQGMMITVNTKNVGRSTAVDVTSRSVMEISPQGEYPDIELGADPGDVPKVVVGPNQFGSGAAFTFFGDNLKRILHGGEAVYVGTKIEYRSPGSDLVRATEDWSLYVLSPGYNNDSGSIVHVDVTRVMYPTGNHAD